MTPLMKPTQRCKMKKLFPALIVSCFFYESLSNEVKAIHLQQPQISSIFPQWRVGIGMAVEYASVESNLKIMPIGSLGDISSAQSHVAKKIQVAPCIEIGSFLIDNYYIGLVTSWRRSGAKDSSRSPIRGTYHFSHELRINNYIDLLVKPGVRHAPNLMFYGLIGPSIANWSHTTHEFLVPGHTGIESSIGQFKKNKRSIGLGIGLGFEYAFKEQYTISVDYTSHFHKSISDSHHMSYEEQYISHLGPGKRERSGLLARRIKPSYSTLALRFTVFI